MTSEYWRLAVASLLFFFLGIGIRGIGSSPPTTPPDQAQFILLLRTGSSAGDLTAVATREEYAEWARSLSRQGIWIRGEKLGSSGLQLGPDGQMALTTPSEEQVEGYFLVRSESLQAAAELAEGCPHLRYGGNIEVRAIDEH